MPILFKSAGGLTSAGWASKDFKENHKFIYVRALNGMIVQLIDKDAN